MVFDLRAVWQRDPGWAEMVSGVALMMWAMVVVASPDMLSQNFFWPLLQVLSQRGIVQITCMVGLLQLAAVLINSRLARIAACGLAACVLTSLTVNLLELGRWPPGNIGLYAALGLGNYFALVRNVRKGIT